MINAEVKSLFEPRIKKICFPSLALGTAYYFGENYSKAIEIFDEVLQMNPDNFTAHTNRYFSLQKLGKSSPEDLALVEKFKLKDAQIEPRHPFNLSGTTIGNFTQR